MHPACVYCLGIVNAGLCGCVNMNILALEPYYGGSHRAFLDGWIENSRHTWTLLTLPATKWKWRMRHAAVTFAGEVGKHLARGQIWDVLLCSDMLNLAEFLGLLTDRLPQIPTIAYFHENQLTYPVRFESERDYQFAMTNMTTALAACGVWFNSAFHRNEFLSALQGFLKRMPDNQPTDAVDRIRAKSAVYPPGINPPPARRQRKPGPLRIIWAARWEHDKNPEDFFEALKLLTQEQIDFCLSVIGPRFREVPEVFAWAEQFFADHIDRWGCQSTRADYESALAEADIIVSTANHEFFGLSVAEAIAAGAFPVLPRRLSYPEILSSIEMAGADEFFYDGTVGGLAKRLADLAKAIEDGNLWLADSTRGARGMKRFYWQNLTPVLDNALQKAKA